MAPPLAASPPVPRFMVFLNPGDLCCRFGIEHPPPFLLLESPVGSPSPFPKSCLCLVVFALLPPRRHPPPKFDPLGPFPEALCFSLRRIFLLHPPCSSRFFFCDGSFRSPPRTCGSRVPSLFKKGSGYVSLVRRFRPLVFPFVYSCFFQDVTGFFFPERVFFLAW